MYVCMYVRSIADGTDFVFQYIMIHWKLSLAFLSSINIHTLILIS